MKKIAEARAEFCFEGCEKLKKYKYCIFVRLYDKDLTHPDD